VAGAGTVSPEKMAEARTKEATAKAVGKEQATTTAATRTMKEAAPKVRDLANETEAALERITAGPYASRLQNYMAGKVGAPNPDFIAYKDNADLLSSLLMRMHTGSRSSEYMGQKFDNMIGANKQSAENMKSTLRVIRRYTDIVQGAKEGEGVGIPEGEQAGAAGGGVVQITDPATEIAKLPSGTRFRLPDGRTGTVK